MKLLLIALLVTSPAYAGDHENDKEHCERHEHHEVIVHEAPAPHEVIVHEVIVHEAPTPHEPIREHAVREPVIREPVIHEPVVREPAREVVLHRDLHEHDLRENCHNQWMTDQFCKERVAK